MTQQDRLRSVPDIADAAPLKSAGYGGYGGQRPLAEEDAGDFDLRAILLKLWHGKWIIAICLMLGGLFGVLNSTQQPARFFATGKVMFDVPRANVDAGQDVVGDVIGPLRNQIEVLRSTALLERVVDDLNLTQNPAFNPALRPPPEPTWRDRIAVPPEIQDLLITMGLREPIAIGAPPPDPVAAEERLRRQIVETLRLAIRLRPIENSQVLEIGYESGNARLAAAIVNSVSEQYIVDQLEGRLDTFRSATAWLTERVEDLQERVETAEAAVLASQAQIALNAGVSLAAVQQQLAASTTARNLAQDGVSTLTAQYARLSGALESGASISALPEFRENEAIAALLEREIELRGNDNDLADTLRPSHPTRLRLAEDLEQVRAQIRFEAEQVVEAVRLQLDVAQEREAQLREEIRDLQARELQLSTEAVEVRNLEREAQASRILYENLLSRLQETNAQEDLQTADARILTPAEVPLSALPTAQNRSLTTGLVAGFALGIGIVFLLDRLNNTFRSPFQLEEMLGVPVLATVPRAGSNMKRADVVQRLREKPNSALAESVRNLRTSILLSNVDVAPKVVMFSSSVPREGKSTTSMLMALTSRQMGKSAVIVDCDLRMPALAKVLQVKDETPGLLSVLYETASIDEAIYVEESTGLHVLMTRPSERVAKINAADVLASAKFRHIIEVLASRYDRVILDTPPTLVVADARIVSELADAVVFCVRWDNTPRDAVKEGLRELLSVGAPVAGVAMTLVDEQRAATYSYDGYSYYKGRYRDYYEA
ncbi:MAG: polysaccharide biosynthesis tyrosine autokinase [Pseudomonadota bacterium]